MYFQIKRPFHYGKALYNFTIKFNLKYYNTFPILLETTTHHHMVTGVFHNRWQYM